MTVQKIVERYLTENGFDGLFSEYGDCSCEIGDLAPCTVDFSTCKPGYRYVCKGEADCEYGPEEHWHMRSKK